MICGGVFWLTGNPRTLMQRNALPGIRFAILTGFAIAAYTVWDAYAVSQLMIAPLLFQSMHYPQIGEGVKNEYQSHKILFVWTPGARNRAPPIIVLITNGVTLLLLTG